MPLAIGSVSSAATLRASARASASHRGRRRASIVVVRASASSSSSSDDDDAATTPPSLPSRRAAMLAGFVAAATSAMMTTRVSPARASSADMLAGVRTKVCDPTADGAECRANEIGKDLGGLGDYDQKANKKVELAKAMTNPNMTNYQLDTMKLVDECAEVLALDVYDLTREKRIGQLVKDGNVWSSKYAPGGSSKTASGRAFYNAINQVSGHFNFNGIAPLPKSRLDVVNANLEDTRKLIEQGR